MLKNGITRHFEERSDEKSLFVPQSWKSDFSARNDGPA
jgi:hypothetical protein